MRDLAFSIVRIRNFSIEFDQLWGGWEFRVGEYDANVGTDVVSTNESENCNFLAGGE